MRSMTGFGRAELERGGVQVVAEVRALNQRFFELKLNLPRGWGEHEAEIRRIVQEVVERGRVELFVRCVTLKPPPARLRVNDELAANYVAELRRLGKTLRLDGALSIDVVMQRPEIFQVVEEEYDARPGLELAFLGLRRALKILEAERTREGSALKRDFDSRIKKLTTALPRIEKLAQESRAAIRASFENRVRELLAELPINEKRLLDEAANAAQHGDITEEMTRLNVHLKALKALITRNGPIGKSMEFLLQEINREVNTMGAKSQTAALAQTTIEMKGELEKMREQVQNVE
ncbi:MAG TPA: YicC/YloC family endoribonuclease [Candidatus Binataceae bacterium]|nr:YicC/YloC family endoribonuclease [Candidatus Binataceae bacterium]